MLLVPHRHKKSVVIAGIILILFLFLSSLFSVHVLEGWQRKVADTLYYDKTVSDTIVIVAIDDRSLQELGRWPWNRERFSELFLKLKESTVVGLDVAMFELFDDGIDKRLGEILRSNGNVVIPIEFVGLQERNDTVKWDSILKPIEPLREIGTGFVNVISDDDGVVRSTYLALGKYNSFPLVMAEKIVGDISVPEKEAVRIAFAGKPGSFTTISFVDALRENINFDSKIVLIGATAPDLHDDAFVPTSGGKAMAGVEIHAHTLQMILRKDFLAEQARWQVVLIIGLLTLVVGTSISFLPLRWASALTGMALPIYIGFSMLLFRNGIIPNVVYPLLAIVLTYTATVSYSYVFEGRERKKALRAFQQYVSPEVIHEIMKHPEKLKLGGEKREITVLFSDVRGFTSFSEKLKPEQLVRMLNEYLTVMSDVLMAEKGLIDKYIGDAIMAFWGAPLNNKQHARDASAGALEMVQELSKIQKKFAQRNWPVIDIGIGLNTGDAVVGNMGSEKRFNYTAMGDVVNLASRLEGLTKQYGVKIILSESTQKYIDTEFLCRELDYVQVKGKKQAVRIYELVGAKGITNEFVELFEQGLQLYYKQQWDNALKLFRKSLQLNKEDKTTGMYIERCMEFKKHSPGKNWEGVWEWKSK